METAVAGLKIRPASKVKSRLRMALDGVSGSGKTFTALRFAMALGKKVLVISSETGAVDKYKGFNPDGIPFDFQVLDLPNFSPDMYTQAVMLAGQEKFDVVIIDSLSHAWAGAGGALEIKDDVAARSRSGNSYFAWRDVTPMHNRMVEAILHSPCHVIATMRAKTAYVLETGSDGKQVPRKIGMEPVQRAGMEYEFDVYASLDDAHILYVTKTRCWAIDGMRAIKPGASFIQPVIDWLNDGIEPPADFFAVTEEDLKKFEKRISEPSKEERAEKLAAKPKTAAQLLAEKKKTAQEEKVAEKAAEAKVADTEHPAASSPASPSAATAKPAAAAESNGCTKEQSAAILDLFLKLNIPKEDQEGILKRRNAIAVRNLSAEKAAELISVLKAKLADVEKGADPPAGTTVRNDDPATATQVSRVQTLVQEVAQLQPDIADRIKAKLTAHKLEKIKDLTVSECDQLIRGLEIKNLDLWVTSILEGHATRAIPF